MKISEKTLNVFKNFATINESLNIRKGNIQKTIDNDETIIAEIVVPDQFPKDFCIYDLSVFLANLTTLNDPDLTFDEKFLTMKDDSVSVRFFYGNPHLIKSLPDEDAIDLENTDVSFVLPQSSFEKLNKVSKLNALPIMTVIGKEGKLILQSQEEGNDSSTAVSLELGKHEGEDFRASFKMANLRLLPDNYKVSIALEGYAIFENENKNTRYIIALQEEGKK